MQIIFAAQLRIEPGSNLLVSHSDVKYQVHNVLLCGNNMFFFFFFFFNVMFSPNVESNLHLVSCGFFSLLYKTPTN